jgi:hypothetical protein
MDSRPPDRSQLQGLKYFKALLHGLDQLRARHDHFNRTLFYDEYLLLLLLAYYNPSIKSLRGLVQLSDSPSVERNLGLHHTSLGSLSAASKLFDPTLLHKIFVELAATASAKDGPRRPAGTPSDLRVVAADASLFKMLPRMCRELFSGPRTRAPKGHLKAHFIFNVFDSAPVQVDLTAGKTDERHVLPTQLQSGALYLLDRGYQSYKLFRKILDMGSSFIVRLRKDCNFTVLEQRSISPDATNAGVLSDCIAVLGTDSAMQDRPVRVIQARFISPPPRNLDPKRNRGKYAGYAPGESIIHNCTFVTDRLDMPAELVVELYRYRWQVEIFFRWFKCVLNCQHLFAESENGMALQIYAALIASLLVVIHTGRRPNKMLLLSIQLYLQGLNTWESVERQIARAKVTNEK